MGRQDGKGGFYGENGAAAYDRTVNQYGEQGASILQKRWFWATTLFAALFAGTAAGAFSIEEISQGVAPEFTNTETGYMAGAGALGGIVGFILSQVRASFYRSTITDAAQSAQFGYERKP